MTGTSRSDTIRLEAKNNFGGPRILIPAVMLVAALIAAIAGAFLVAGVIAAIAMIGLQLLGRDALVAVLRWNAPELEVSRNPLLLGSQPVVTYHRKPKRATDIGDCEIACRVYCEEEVKYRQGSSTTTDTFTVFEDRASGRGFGTATGLTGDVVLNISAHAGAPTLDLSNNRVRWVAETQVTGARIPNDKHRFVLKVGAELDQRYRSQVQDS